MDVASSGQQSRLKPFPQDSRYVARIRGQPGLSK